MAFDTVLYLLLALFALLLICVPSVLGYRSSPAASVASRVASFVGFLLFVIGSVLASSCLLGDCLHLGASVNVVAPYLWFFGPGALFSLIGWSLALLATDRRQDNRRFLLILLAPAATLFAALVVGGGATLFGATGAGMWITVAAYLTPCLSLFILLAVPKGRAEATATPR